MKYCPNCGKEVQADDKFCENCGFNLSKINEPKKELTKDSSVQAKEKTKEKVNSKVQTVRKQAKNWLDSSKLKNNRKKLAIIGTVIIVLLVILGVAIHKRNLQPDHALINKPYIMTINAKITTEGFLSDKTENSTDTFYIYLNSKNKQALSAKNKADLNSLLKDKDSSDQGTNYSLDDNTLKFSDNSDQDSLSSLQINAIHRSGDGYTGTIQSSNDDSAKISGTVSFHKP